MARKFSGSISSSPDYVSYTGGLRLTGDFNDKLITPTIGYTYSRDRIGGKPILFLLSETTPTTVREDRDGWLLLVDEPFKGWARKADFVPADAGTSDHAGPRIAQGSPRSAHRQSTTREQE